MSDATRWQPRGRDVSRRPRTDGGPSDHLERELTYPISHEAVLEQIGSMEIEAPDADRAETVEAIVGTVGQERYESAEALFNTILGNVGDDYIGRKFYDDRGGNPTENTTEPKDEENVSF
jgi:hypothetical protein